MGEVSLTGGDWGNFSSRGKHGASSELIASAKLMEAGYDAYRAVEPHAPFDLVAYRDDKLYRVEVKSLSKNRSNGEWAPVVPWPKNDHWDLLIVVGLESEVFCFDSQTSREEVRDKIRAFYGYEVIGDRNPHSYYQGSLRDRDEEIRQLAEEGLSREEIARRFHISSRRVGQVIQSGSCE